MTDYLKPELSAEEQKKFFDEAEELVYDFLQQAGAEAGQLMVVGCSTSEVLGGHIGKNGCQQLGEVIARAVRAQAASLGVIPCAQCCEHLNRALVMERAEALHRGLKIVHAVPKPHAGGSLAAGFYQQLDNPVLVEAVQADCGLDIGQTLVGMHLRPVAVPLRLTQKTYGQAIVTAAYARPPLIGGERAEYR